MSPSEQQASGGRSSRRRRGTGRRRLAISASLQMAAIGLFGAALNLLIVQTSLSGLHDVEMGHAAEVRIVAAQRAFQNADQLHDALHADVLQAVLYVDDSALALPGDPAGGMAADARGFRADLDAAAAVPLPGSLLGALREVRPLEEQYVSAAERITREARSDPAAANRDLPGFIQVFIRLEDQQAGITAQLADQAQRFEERAARGERTARVQIAVAAAGALLGFLGLAALLGRQGRRLVVLAARERGVAETLQHSLLPDRLPDLAGVGLAARYVPGGSGVEVGGDWYDVIPLPGGEVGLVMGDVVGHDLGAASVMGQMRNALRAYAAEGLDPGQVLERLNELCHQQRTSAMATCVYAVLDPVASVLTVANAGHYPPLLVSPRRETSYLERAACPPVGAVREACYPVTTYPLEPGSSVVLYTDGLVERRTRDVDEGLDRLRSEAAVMPADLEAACDHLLGELLADGPPQDDVALLVVAPAARLGEHLELVLPADPTRLVDLRRALTRWLQEAGAQDVECYEMTVACSEAATNAIEHAYGPGGASYQVIGDVDPATGLVTLVVQDWGRWRSPRGRDRGRGLRLIDALMDESRVFRGDAATGGTIVEMRRRLAHATRPLSPGSRLVPAEVPA